VKSAKVQTLAD